LYKNLPSQGSASLVIFYVDFPDCSYSSSADLTSAEITEIAFGDEDKSDTNYPFDSMSAFYSRSSKGSMELSGTAIRYTAKENISSYSGNKAKLVEECYDAFKNSVDFSQYDGDGDGRIDATLISVPTSAGDSDWWPCAGGFGDDSYKVDGKTLGHLITGNAQIESSSDYAYFNSSYLHEMGHCMGLPDYYLYYTDDWDSMLGEGGVELMDGDAYSDFGAFSKLMLGWYRENQVQVYDTSDSSPQTFTLTNAQTEEGNCLIIPYGTLSSTYTDNEYFVLEYTTLEENNSAVAGYWWQDTPSSGVRIYHVKTDVYDNGWWKFLKYQNGSEFTDTDGDGTADDQGIRLIRLVGSDTGSSIFRTGSVINSSTSGFGWYDSSENESIDPGVSISIGNLSDGSYTVTVTKN
jgi:M6 family metalloprotease-like protein